MGLKERQAELLSRLECESGGTITAKAIAHWAGCTERTAHRWIAGDSLIQVEELNELLRCESAPPALGEGLFQIVLTGTRFVSVIAAPAPRAGDRDGGPRTRATKAAGITGPLRSLADMVDAYENAIADYAVDDAELEKIRLCAEETYRGIARFIDGIEDSRALRPGPRPTKLSPYGPHINGLNPADADRSRRPVGAAG